MLDPEEGLLNRHCVGIYHKSPQNTPVIAEEQAMNSRNFIHL